MKFEQYYISEDIKKNLGKLGFKRPTDIQFKAIPSIIDGEDVLAIAQTGTGKTAAFAIPVIDKIHRYKTSKRSRGIKCIVMVPTRELALQIGEVFKSLANHTKVKVFTLHGGVEQDRQIAKLQDGIDVLIATPGRMFDLINQQVLKLDYVSTLVLDEADHMLDLGFIEDIKYIKKMLKRAHQTLFFSATISDEIKKLAYSQVKSAAIRIQVSPKDRVSKNISHFVMFVELDDKRFFLNRFLQDHPGRKVIVFVRTKVRAERVNKAMERAGFSAVSIHGDKDQAERSEAMSAFRNGESLVLIATDISARGIDVPDVDYVINYDLPEKVENYVHRVGRTGRGIRMGEAISFCSTEEKSLLDDIQAFISKPIDVIHMSKEGYAEIIRTPDKAAQELMDLVAEHDSWLSGKGKKKKKRKKS
ncbi:ATP-dependent RNA helicase DBP3 [Mariprofundus micogutta]|uniref:ATP-dependent RNA helicase DBP3 n=1 Tax=Mariprofundus micogutta TaxID=1921010 RepID=A0A1L8CR49_9PROT|nr:DEAD/DEAH box helicase [Mariprofundus micogutta]GAV21344.1 ATP-dependent RNA helicase DBP3 [Mariprofundus micogutta]